MTDTDQPATTGEQPAPDAGNTEDLSQLTEDLDDNDDVYTRLEQVSPDLICLPADTVTTDESTA